MATRRPKKPPPRTEDADQKVRRFQVRAAPILAAHGGINAASQIKLRALARELGLSEEEFLAAVSGPADAGAAHPTLSPEEQHRLERFAKNVVRSLRKQKRDVLTAPVEHALIDAGCNRYELPEEIARGTVRRVAVENGIRAVSKAEARQYLAEMVSQRVGENGWIDHATWQRVHSEGKQWGLTRDEVAAVLSRYVTTVRRRGWMGYAALGLALVAVFAVGGLLAFIVLPRDVLQSLTGTVEAEAPAGQPDEESQPPAEKESKPPPPDNEWWDVDLAVAVGRAHRVLEGSGPILQAMQSGDPETRAGAYEHLAGLAPAAVDDAAALQVMREILVGAHALDPSDDAARRLREALLEGLPRRGADVPATEEDFLPVVAAVGTAVAALKREALPDARAEALAVSLGQAIGAPVDRGEERGALARRCLKAVLVRCYRFVTALAVAEPAMARSRFRTLNDAANGLLDQGTRRRLEADVLAALLPRIGEDWIEHESSIRECVASSEPMNVLKMVELYETTTSAELRVFLRELLLRRAGARTDATDPAAVAQLLRERLGLSVDPANMTVPDRWRLLEIRARRIIDEASSPVASPEEALAQAVRLAGLGTLAMALSRGELGARTFDELGRAVFEWKPPQPLPTSGAKPGGRAPRGPYVAPVALAEVDALTKSLRRHRAIDDRDRCIFFITALRRFAGQLQDIQPDQAAVLADYLLSSKPETEFQRVAAHLPGLGRWRALRLALADEMMTCQLSQERAVEVVSGVLGRAIELGREENWRGALRYLLLKDVLERLPQESGAGGSELGRLGNAASEAFMDYLAAESQLLGIPAEEYQAATSPSARLRLEVRRLAAILGRKNLRPEDRARLGELAHRLTAADYLGPTDLARTVLLDRQWLRLAAAEVAARRPQRAAEADRIVADLAARDGGAADLLVQLRDGRRAILQTWLLLSEAP